MLFLSIGIISQYKYSSVEAWQGFLSPNVIKGKKSHSRYYHAVLREIGSLCKANNVKWGKHREKPHLETE